jgi:hypothetical protein
MKETISTLPTDNIMVEVAVGSEGVTARYHFPADTEVVIEKNGILRVGRSLFPSATVRSIVYGGDLLPSPAAGTIFKVSPPGVEPREGITHRIG